MNHYEKLGRQAQKDGVPRGAVPTVQQLPPKYTLQQKLDAQWWWRRGWDLQAKEPTPAITLADLFRSTPPVPPPRSPKVPLGADPIPVFDFGKHRGKTHDEVLEEEPSYIVWAYETVAAHAGISRSTYLAASEAAGDADDADREDWDPMEDRMWGDS